MKMIKENERRRKAFPPILNAIMPLLNIEKTNAGFLDKEAAWLNSDKLDLISHIINVDYDMLFEMSKNKGK